MTLGLPRDALVSVIVRNGEAVAPRGSTTIRTGDRLHVLVRREVASEVEACRTAGAAARWARRHGLAASSAAHRPSSPSGRSTSAR